MVDGCRLVTAARQTDLAFVVISSQYQEAEFGPGGAVPGFRQGGTARRLPRASRLFHPLGQPFRPFGYKLV